MNKEIYNGKIKFYNEEKCFGFAITIPDGEECYISKKEADRVGITFKNKNNTCTFEINSNSRGGRPYAVNIVLK
jgi:cold shock CspA family protein